MASQIAVLDTLDNFLEVQIYGKLVDDLHVKSIKESHLLIAKRRTT